jgi:hypothetical protein
MAEAQAGSKALARHRRSLDSAPAGNADNTYTRYSRDEMTQANEIRKTSTARLNAKEDEMKMLLKGCRRCGGDLIPDRADREHRTMACLQCGLEVRIRFVGPSLAILQMARPLVA